MVVVVIVSVVVVVVHTWQRDLDADNGPSLNHCCLFHRWMSLTLIWCTRGNWAFASPSTIPSSPGPCISSKVISSSLSAALKGWDFKWRTNQAQVRDYNFSRWMDRFGRFEAWQGIVFFYLVSDFQTPFHLGNIGGLGRHSFFQPVVFWEMPSQSHVPRSQTTPAQSWFFPLPPTALLLVFGTFIRLGNALLHVAPGPICFGNNRTANLPLEWCQKWPRMNWHLGQPGPSNSSLLRPQRCCWCSGCSSPGRLARCTSRGWTTRSRSACASTTSSSCLLSPSSSPWSVHLRVSPVRSVGGSQLNHLAQNCSSYPRMRSFGIPHILKKLQMLVLFPG